MSSVPLPILDIQQALDAGIISGLPGKNFCLTGKMSVTRAVMEELIMLLGGTIDKGVWMSTQYLVIPNDPVSTKGNKYKDAVAKGTTIVTEAWLVEQILGVEDGQ